MRSRFVDFAGHYVIHCHILAHEDRGMMTIVAGGAVHDRRIRINERGAATHGVRPAVLVQAVDV